MNPQTPISLVRPTLPAVSPLMQSEMIPGLISVIMPNYNHAHYLPAAIESVLRQSYPHYEIIVIDDGSTDSSRAVATSYGEPVHYLWQKNSGLAAARNTGLQAARGEFISLLDADDMLEPAFFATLLTLLRADPTAQGIYCGYRFVDQQNRPLPQVENRVVAPQQLYNVLLNGNFLVPAAMLLYRHCYEEAGPYDSSLRGCEDWDLWLKILKRHRVLATDQVLVRYRISTGSLSSEPIRNYDGRIAVLAKNIGPEPSEPASADPVVARAYGAAYLQSAIEYLQVQNAEFSYELLGKAARVFPALFYEMPTFYELGCGSQAKGSRHDSAALDVPGNAQVVRAMVRRLLAEPTLAGTIGGQPGRVYAAAHWGLGVLEYNAGQRLLARKNFVQALRYQPRLAAHGPFRSALLRTLLGATVIKWLKQRVGVGGLRPVRQ